MNFFKKNTVTLDKEKLVEAWMRSAYVTGIPAQYSAAQFLKFEELLDINVRKEVDLVCNRVRNGDLSLGMGEN